MKPSARPNRLCFSHQALADARALKLGVNRQGHDVIAAVGVHVLERREQIVPIFRHERIRRPLAHGIHRKRVHGTQHPSCVLGNQTVRHRRRRSLHVRTDARQSDGRSRPGITPSYTASTRPPEASMSACARCGMSATCAGLVENFMPGPLRLHGLPWTGWVRIISLCRATIQRKLAGR